MSKLHHVFKLPKTVWGLSLVSLLSNSSSVIISSLSVTLITDVLGGSAKDLGVIRGITKAFGYAMKLCSGMISDYLGRRKILIIIGYTAAAFAKHYTQWLAVCGCILRHKQSTGLRMACVTPLGML